METLQIQQESQEQKIKAIIEQLNILEAERLRQGGYTNECFFKDNGELQDSEKYHLKEKTKYFYIDKGTSGVFMIDKEKGQFWTIKAYGQKNYPISEDRIISRARLS